MKVRLKTIMAGPTCNHGVGDIADLPQAQAYDLIERGHAEQLEPDPQGSARIEAAVAAPAEVAMMPPAGRKVTPPTRRRASGA